MYLGGGAHYSIPPLRGTYPLWTTLHISINFSYVRARAACTWTHVLLHGHSAWHLLLFFRQAVPERFDELLVKYEDARIPCSRLRPSQARHRQGTGFRVTNYPPKVKEAASVRHASCRPAPQGDEGPKKSIKPRSHRIQLLAELRLTSVFSIYEDIVFSFTCSSHSQGLHEQGIVAAQDTSRGTSHCRLPRPIIPEIGKFRVTPAVVKLGIVCPLSGVVY
jgi:hypothetical protein